MEQHECIFGPGEYSRLAGTWHRKCIIPFCKEISLDYEEDECSE
jgi:hypothetical protein